jgi:hypothetical protein
MNLELDVPTETGRSEDVVYQLMNEATFFLKRRYLVMAEMARYLVGIRESLQKSGLDTSLLRKRLRTHYGLSPTYGSLLVELLDTFGFETLAVHGWILAKVLRFLKSAPIEQQEEMIDWVKSVPLGCVSPISVRMMICSLQGKKFNEKEKLRIAIYSDTVMEIRGLKKTIDRVIRSLRVRYELTLMSIEEVFNPPPQPEPIITREMQHGIDQYLALTESVAKKLNL